MWDLINTGINELMYWALDAPDHHLYIVMGVLFLLLIALIWSMFPKRSQRVRIVKIEPVVYYPQNRVVQIETRGEAEYKIPVNVIPGAI